MILPQKLHYRTKTPQKLEFLKTPQKHDHPKKQMNPKKTFAFDIKTKTLANKKSTRNYQARQSDEAYYQILVYHAKIIFNIASPEKGRGRIFPKNGIIFYDPRNTTKAISEKERNFLLFFSLLFFCVSLVEIYNQANARNKSGVMYKSHLNASAWAFSLNKTFFIVILLSVEEDFSISGAKF